MTEAAKLALELAVGRANAENTGIHAGGIVREAEIFLAFLNREDAQTKEEA